MRFLLLFLLFCLPFSSLKAQDNLVQLESIYQQYIAAGNFQEALPVVLAMLAKGQKELSTQDTAYAQILYKLADLYEYLGDGETAIQYLEQATDIQKIKIPKHADYAKSLHLFGILYRTKGDYVQSERYFRQALAIRKEALGEKHPRYAATLYNLGLLYDDKGDYAQAEVFHIQALDIRREVLGEQHYEYAASLNNLGNLYYKLGNYGKAESYYLRALQIQKETLGETHTDYAASLNNLAMLYNGIGDYSKAEDFYLQALQIQKKVWGETHPDYATSLDNLGILYSNQGDYSKAEKFYTQATEIRKMVLGEKHYEYAAGLSRLGDLNLSSGNYSKAEGYFLQALAIEKNVLGENHPYYAASLGRLGSFYQSLGDYPKAERFYLQRLAIEKIILGEKHPTYAGGLNLLATVYKNKNQLDLAWQQALAAIQSNTDLALSAHISEAWVDSLKQAPVVSFDNIDNSLILIYKLLEKEKRPEARAQQLLIGEVALALLERSKNELSADEDKLRILARSNLWVANSIKVLDKTKDAGKALNLVEQNKSVLLLDAMSNKRAYSFGILPDSLVQEEKNLQDAYTNTKAALAEKRSPEEREILQKQLMDLNLKTDIFKKQIKAAYPKYAALKYQHTAVQAQEIQAMLDEKTALLEYLLGDSLVYIFYIDKKQVHVHEFLVNNDSLKSQIEALHKALSSYELISQNPELAYQSYTQPAYWFYDKLVAPALAHAQNISQLIIIADGELGYLPFETFLREPAPSQTSSYRNLHYLINDFNISYNYSATLWKENKTNKQRNNNRQILGMAANYETPENPMLAEFRLPTDIRLRKLLSPLPAAQQEVVLLSENFSGFFAFDSLASERVFKQKAAEFAVIHLAMHGLLNKKEQMLSSLAFTEDSDSTENNFLHAYEISKMELNADLVVLSACETGYGKFERGNGIASLARSFMYAGAPAMVVSLWEVNDRSTGKLMQFFYHNLADGMEKDEALRQAKMQYIQQATGLAAHPAYWSPFVQMGSTEPVNIARKAGGYWLWIGLGAGLLVLAGLLWRRRKA